MGNRFYMSEDGVYEIIPSNFLAEALYLSIENILKDGMDLNLPSNNYPSTQALSSVTE